jgi:cytochrome c oxidase subunit 1
MDLLRPSAPPSPTKIVEAGLAIFVAVLFHLTGLNFVVTGHRMRARHDLVAPAPVHLGALRHQHHQILGTPVIAITIVLVAVERTLHLGIFDPKLGSDPLLFNVLVLFPSAVTS